MTTEPSGVGVVKALHVATTKGFAVRPVQAIEVTPTGITGNREFFIVDIDERSLAELGRWPWNRARLADLVDSIFRQHGALLLGLDVILAEPDESSGLASLDTLGRGPLRHNDAFQAALAGLRPQLDYDGRLAAVFRRYLVVLGFHLSSGAGAASSGELPPPLSPGAGEPAAQLTRWTGYGANLPRLQQAAGAAGFLNAPIDPDGVTRRVLILPFNDVDALAAALADRTVAAVVTEPALTNGVGLVLPEPGYHEALRRITRETGTLLILDETHTQVVGPGGLTRMWGLDPDVVSIGKSIAGGVPLGAYGMTAEVAEVLQRPLGRDDPKPLVATGGTLFGNPLSMAAARATMAEVLSDDAYAHATRLGARLADGLEALVAARGLPWTVHRFWPRSGFTFAPTMPRDAEEAVRDLDVPLRRLQRAYLANRGVWDAIVGAGPTMGTAASEADVDLYVDVTAALLDELRA